MVAEWTILSTFLGALADWAAAVIVVLAVSQPENKPGGTNDQ